jgi:microcystin degradation protein MlrC
MQAGTPESIAVGRGEAAPEGDELAELRATVRALEAELAETHRRANAAIAAAQERVYWLDRWHVDLNELMLRRWAVTVRAVLRGVRAMVRRLRRFTRAIR